MPTPPLPKEKVELVHHEEKLQGYFRMGRYFFRHTLHQGGQSDVISREVFERGQAAGALLYDPMPDEVVLIRQFRAGAYVAGRHPWTWEIVAGIMEQAESAEDMIRREAIEESGLTVNAMMPIHNVLLTPGACSEAARMFLGRVDTTNAGGVFGLAAEGENILVKVVPFAEALGMLDRDEIDNAVTVICLQWLALHRDEVRKRWP